MNNTSSLSESEKMCHHASNDYAQRGLPRQKLSGVLKSSLYSLTKQFYTTVIRNKVITD